jgi:heat shock protein HslJ
MWLKRMSTLLLATLLVSACVASDEEAVSSAKKVRSMNILGSWKIEQIEGKEVNPEFAPRFEFHADGFFSGNSGCNNMSSGYELQGSNLTIAPVAGTRMMCAPEAMAVEIQVYDVLEKVAAADVDEDGRLLIQDLKGNVLLTAKRI